MFISYSAIPNLQPNLFRWNWRSSQSWVCAYESQRFSTTTLELVFGSQFHKFGCHRIFGWPWHPVCINVYSPHILESGQCCVYVDQDFLPPYSFSFFFIVMNFCLLSHFIIEKKTSGKKSAATFSLFSRFRNKDVCV